MKKDTLGKRIAVLRKEKGLTQQALAEQMGVTDKAVSKWERDLSFPDVSSLPQLAEILGVTVDELMASGVRQSAEAPSQVRKTIDTVLKAIPLAMGVAVTALSAMGSLTFAPAMTMLGIGMFCLAIRNFQE